MRRSLFAVVGLLALGACSDDGPAEPPPPPPEVTTGEAVAVAATTATVDGVVDAFGEAGEFWFEFGSDVSYGGSTAPRAIPTSPAGPQTVEETLTGLLPETLVHFRLVARTRGGLGEGDTVTFVTRAANQAPDTQVTAAPTDTTQDGVRAALFWYGSDPDGEVTGFEWRFVDHGADGALDVADSLGVPWAGTAVTDSVFTWPVDTLDRTFFVRAIDDRLARDPTPAAWTFEARPSAIRR